MDDSQFLWRSGGAFRQYPLGRIFILMRTLWGLAFPSIW
jgi:hypothetical protein